jgi:hypothetical protein
MYIFERKFRFPFFNYEKRKKFFSIFLAIYLAVTLFFSDFEKIFTQKFSIHECKVKLLSEKQEKKATI